MPETTKPAPPRPDTRRRPTWREVAASAAALPPLEGVNVASATSETPAERLAPICEYDKRHRRILDFRLPGLDGKPVSFHDFGTDLVLLDFWGTWCDPCLKSIPHLVELQEKTGSKRLTVVGIACEKDVPHEAAKRVSTTAQALKINYPVLLSQNDGSCPLQEALNIGVFPTMILVDREGRVLWRDQGATPSTLARLDRFIASSAKDETLRR